MIWTPTTRMNALQHMLKYMTRIDVVDHFLWIEAYEKLSMLNEAYEQELVSPCIDTKPQIEIERKEEAQKEDDQGKEMEEIKDDRADMGIEVEEDVRDLSDDENK
ncbi:uncharacterized protein A4U43_C07F26330 [Asparagus officinalis]|uniref:Uncharacterized protein n=1 Tax=Asparagus officinalis TaxID=4686 RepID=A0A5P1EEY8_ASPOF|nr:uncharacterized protein A4U43_C07F26330 [Asparagus officinalis]